MKRRSQRCSSAEKARHQKSTGYRSLLVFVDSGRMSEGCRGCEDVIYQTGALMLEHRAWCCRRALGLVGGEQRQSRGWLADPVGFIAGVDGLDID